jgi:hypothetical protein
MTYGGRPKCNTSFLGEIEMAHINIYVDDEMLEKVRTAAEIKHCSLSKFIRSQLEASLKQEDKQ